MKLLSNNLNTIIKRIYGKQNPLLAEIIMNWGKIVGAKFSTKTIPLKIFIVKQSGQATNVLHVQVENSSIALELSFHQQIIIERISLYLGFKAIHSLKIMVYSAAQ
jgi:hypothetical protein